MNSLQSHFIKYLLRRSNLWNKPLEEIRKSMEQLKGKGIPGDVEHTEERIGGVHCEVFRCGETKGKIQKVVLYFHGGGFSLGIYSPTREFVAKIAQETGAAVVLPDYRLAPEAPFPVALEDGSAVYVGLLQKGHDPEQLVVAGDSSGCALGISVLLKGRGEGTPMPGSCCFITPVFNISDEAVFDKKRSQRDPFRLEDPLGIAKNYGDAESRRSPWASPLLGDLRELPPVLIYAAEDDVFFKDSQEFAGKIKSFGGSCEVKNHKGMWHLFPMQYDLVPESRKAFSEFCVGLQSFTG